MGTNYYTKTKTCETCGHKPEGIHLGKSSYGWQFTFQYNGGKLYKNVAEMKEWLKSKKIEDECGDDMSHEEFWKMIKDKQKSKFKNHVECCRKTDPQYCDNEHLIEGYSFSDCEFS